MPLRIILGMLKPCRTFAMKASVKELSLVEIWVHAFRWPPKFYFSDWEYFRIKWCNAFSESFKSTLICRNISFLFLILTNFFAVCQACAKKVRVFCFMIKAILPLYLLHIRTIDLGRGRRSYGFFLWYNFELI